MMFYARAAFAVALLAAGQTVYPAASDETSAKAEVLRADADYRQAVLDGDAAKLSMLFADDILIVHSDGDTDNKVNFLNAISSGRLKMLSYERSDVQVRMHGSTAVLLSKTVKTFSYKGSPGKDTDTSVVVFSKIANQWKIVAMQNTARRN
jgi:uncharacterized protein (TIGR02246 family)